MQNFKKRIYPENIKIKTRFFFPETQNEKAQSFQARYEIREREGSVQRGGRHANFSKQGQACIPVC